MKEAKGNQKVKKDQLGSVHRLYSAHLISKEEAREMLVKLQMLDKA